MIASSPQQAVELLDRAFNERDIDTVMGFYEDEAVVVAEPGRTVRGRAQLRSFFEHAMKSGVSAAQLKTHVVEVDGIALFLSRWTLAYKEPNGTVSTRELVATTVFRNQPGGGWKVLIDNPLGPLVLDA
ncbi:YybH family protein [Pandoraea bronchicola]|uniref:Hydrolase n=1 Tax=Pandoraea bronchicola TaxID=2508287 RepID=A0A5E5BUM5_9BURK|nr:nuclear transport factor 2 family protein [Pandoraea bronchicola]VVE90021.1 hydrolase [Pandoraea bronchicola]